jgi:hypothetical protein
MDGWTGESPLLPDGRQWAWNSSSLGPTVCSREYLYRVRRGLSPKEKSDDLICGFYYAQALEHFHHLRARGLSHADAERDVIRRTLCATHSWTSSNPNKNRENLIRSLVWYLEEFRDDPCKTVILADGKPAVELRGSLQITNEISLAYHIDRLVEHGGDIYVQDQKTTRGSLGPWYFKKFDLDVQMSLYSYIGAVVYRQPVKGVLIDAAQIAVGFTRFGRGFTFRTDAQLDEWLKETIYHIRETWRAAPEYPRRDTACMRYGGCDFFDVCSKPAQVREQYLKADFEVHFRNPLGD